MTKLLENIHRSVNIGLVNEMKIVADKMGINIHEVIDAAATKPFGFVPYKPGPGLGGHCIPIDPYYLTWKAREYGVNTRFIELAGEINHHMPHWVVGKVADALNERGKAVKGSRILVLGLAYKRTSTTRANRLRWKSWTCCKPGARTSATATRTCRCSRASGTITSIWSRCH
ncbi:hypothetical protein [Ottowia beijingensis]|uniref:hypothetical protein n=1 Tax=Ottowia beijingensis TaxID=1207057 RepID=UPI0027DA6741|nr:hypothetical protein [Ottowia beijingensis]